MLEDWVSLGLAPSEFWQCNLREVQVVMAGARRRVEAEFRRNAGLIYTHEQLTGFAMHSPKTMPKFNAVFPDPTKPAVRQTQEDMIGVFRSIAAAMKEKQGVAS